MFQVKVVGIIRPRILCSITFFENCAFYEIMWKNIVQPNCPQMTIWHVCIACWNPKSTNTYLEYVILIAFPLQQWFHEHVPYYIIHTLPVLFVRSSIGSGDNSLSEQLSSNAQARALKLELENRRLLSTIDNLKESSFHESSNKILELEKEKKKLSLKVRHRLYTCVCGRARVCVGGASITKFNVNLPSMYIGHGNEVGVDINICLLTRM